MGISTGAAILGGSVISGVLGSKAAKKAAKVQAEAADQSVAESRRQFDTVLDLQRPAIETGNRARTALERLYGIGAPAAAAAPTSVGASTGRSVEYVNVGPFGLRVQVPAQASSRSQLPYNPALRENGVPQPVQSTPAASADPNDPENRYGGFYASPGYRFRLDQGSAALERSAAARGKLFSGQTGKALVEYGQGVASDEFGNYVRGLQSMAGLGQTAADNSSNAAIQTGRAIGDTLMTSAGNRGSAYQAGAASINNAVQGGLTNWLIYRGLGG